MISKERGLFVAILVLAVLIAGFCGYAFSASPSPNSTFSNGNSDRNTMVVVGTGTVKASPTIAKLTLGVTTQAETATDALEQNAERMNRVISALKNMGITEDEIETSYFSLSPLYGYDDKWSQPKIVGYRVTNRLFLTTGNFDMLGRIIDEAVRAGANEVYGVYFTLKDEELASLKQQARVKAAQAASSAAATLASALDVEIVGVAQVVEQWYSPYPYYRLLETYGTPAENAKTPIIPGEQEITVTIQATYLIE